MKILALLFVFILAFAVGQDDLLTKIIDTTELSDNDNLMILFIYASPCMKCNISQMSLYHKIKSENHDNVKFIALVRCDRDIEMRHFLESIDWKEYSLRDDGKAKKILGCGSEDVIQLRDKQGRMLNIDDSNIYESYEEVKRFIKY